jgi:hypothetical protein
MNEGGDRGEQGKEVAFLFSAKVSCRYPRQRAEK